MCICLWVYICIAAGLLYAMAYRARVHRLFARVCVSRGLCVMMLCACACSIDHYIRYGTTRPYNAQLALFRCARRTTRAATRARRRRHHRRCVNGNQRAPTQSGSPNNGCLEFAASIRVHSTHTAHTQSFCVLDALRGTTAAVALMRMNGLPRERALHRPHYLRVERMQTLWA